MWFCICLGCTLINLCAIVYPAVLLVHKTLYKKIKNIKKIKKLRQVQVRQELMSRPQAGKEHPTPHYSVQQHLILNN